VCEELDQERVRVEKSAMNREKREGGDELTVDEDELAHSG